MPTLLKNTRGSQLNQVLSPTTVFIHSRDISSLQLHHMIHTHEFDSKRINIMAEEKGRTILVAVDEGDESVYALSWCFRNVVCDRNPKDTIVLLYAKPARAVYTAMDATGYLFSPDTITTMETYGIEVAKSVMDKAKEVCKSLNDQVKVETMVEHGDPRDVICDVADKLKVDCLVIGSHGYGAIKRAFLGSVSNHCAQNVKCPVLIVKKPRPDAAHHHHQ